MEIVFGRNACIAVLKQNRRTVFEILISKAKQNEYNSFISTEYSKLIKIVDDSYLRKVSKEEFKHQGIVLRCGNLQTGHLNDIIFQANGSNKYNIFVLDSINDPHNLGAILRSSYCLGINAVIIQNIQSCGINGSVVRSSAGYSEFINIVTVPNLSQAVLKLKQNDFFTASLDVNAKNNIELNDFVNSFQKKCFIFGSEGSGVSKILLDNSDYSIRLKMKEDAESLNVGVAAAIVAYANLNNS